MGGKITNKAYDTISHLIIGTHHVSHKIDTATLGRAARVGLRLRRGRRGITRNNTTNGNLLSKEDADER